MKPFSEYNGYITIAEINWTTIKCLYQNNKIIQMLLFVFKALKVNNECEAFDLASKYVEFCPELKETVKQLIECI